MQIFEIRNDHRFAGMVPADLEFDTSRLVTFLGDPSTPFPIQSLVRLSDHEEPTEKPLADAFLLYGLPIPVVRVQACSNACELLKACVTEYKCHSSEGEFVALKVIDSIDSLDYSKSNIEFAYSTRDQKKMPRDVREYHFDITKLARAQLFKIPEFPFTKLFATEEVASSFAKYKLNGLDFQKVFPCRAREDLVQKHIAKRKRKRH